MKKLKAFTIMELLVAMLISSIVVATAYQGYNLSMKLVGEQRKNDQQTTQIYQLLEVISRDFRVCEIIEQRGVNELACIYKDRETIYSFSPKGVGLIINGTEDFFALQDCTPLFTVEENLSNERLLRRLDLSFSLKGKEVNFSAFKEYTADVFVNYQSNEP